MNDDLEVYAVVTKLRYYPRICLEGLNENTKNLSYVCSVSRQSTDLPIH
jgi:hypothetical protein